MNRKESLWEIMGEIDEELIAEAGRDRGRVRLKSRKGQFLKAAGIALLAATAGIYGIFPDVRAAVATRLGALLGIEEEISAYTKKIGISKTLDGITVTLSEALLMGNQLYTVFEITWEEGVRFPEGEDVPPVGSSKKTKINGEEMENFGRSVYCLRSDEKERVLEIVVESAYEEEALPEEIKEVEVTLTSAKETKGEGYEPVAFSFSFSTSREELEKEARTAKVNRELVTGKGSRILLEQLTLNIIGSSITGSLLEGTLEESYVLKGKDSLGNPVRYEMRRGGGSSAAFSAGKSEEGIHTRISSGGEKEWELLFQTDPFYGEGSKPDLECEWIELQLYRYMKEGEEREKQESGGDCAESFLVPVGEAFRIELPGERGSF